MWLQTACDASMAELPSTPPAAGLVRNYLYQNANVTVAVYGVNVSTIVDVSAPAPVAADMHSLQLLQHLLVAAAGSSVLHSAQALVQRL
jgi:hypothetical protein